jgi:anti-anti-sigma factor
VAAAEPGGVAATEDEAAGNSKGLARTGSGVLLRMDFDRSPEIATAVMRPDHVPPTSIRVVHNGAVSIVTLTGDHDVSSAPALRECVEQELAEHRACVIDLRGATLVDSTVLGVLLDVCRHSRALDLELPVVLNGNRYSAVRRLVKTTMVTLRTLDDLAEAVAIAHESLAPAVPV